MPFTTTPHERDLALALGIPLYGADPRHPALRDQDGLPAALRAGGRRPPAGPGGHRRPRRRGRGAGGDARRQARDAPRDRQAQRRRRGPRQRRRRPAGPAGTALVLLVATLMGGLAPQSCGSTGTNHRAVCGRARRHPRQLPRLDPRTPAPRYGTRLERHRRDLLDRDRLRPPRRPRRAGPARTSPAPAGRASSSRATWERYGVDGDGDGVKDRYDPADAIPGTANLLRQNGAPGDYGRAIFAYNHAGWYVDDVLARAARYRGAARDNPTPRELRRRRRRRADGRMRER